MLCQICSRPHEAIFKRYGFYSCNACALFFRRSVNLRISYVCIGDTNCLTEPNVLGIQCRGCRYKKCIQIGMSVPEMSKNQKVSPKKCLKNNPKTPVSPEIYESSTALLNVEAKKINEEKAKTLYYLLDTVIDFPHLLESYLNGENENLAKIYFDTVISSSTTETINYFVSLFEKYPIPYDELSTVCHICVCKIEYFWLSEAHQTKIKELQKAGYVKIEEKNSDESRLNELETFSHHAMNIFNDLFSY